MTRTVLLVERRCVQCWQDYTRGLSGGKNVAGLSSNTILIDNTVVAQKIGDPTVVVSASTSGQTVSWVSEHQQLEWGGFGSVKGDFTMLSRIAKVASGLCENCTVHYEVWTGYGDGKVGENRPSQTAIWARRVLLPVGLRIDCPDCFNSSESHINRHWKLRTDWNSILETAVLFLFLEYGMIIVVCRVARHRSGGIYSDSPSAPINYNNVVFSNCCF